MAKKKLLKIGLRFEFIPNLYLKLFILLSSHDAKSL